MILGVGTDAIDIDRIARALARHGDRFTHRLFTPLERARADRREPARAASYAKRFAAKEACAKALGTGLAQGIYWRDMGVVNMKSGQPTIKLTGGAASRLAEITPPGYGAAIHVSLTDEPPLAHALVIIAAVIISAG